MDVKVKLAVGVAALAGLALVSRPLWNTARPLEVAPATPQAELAPAAPVGDAATAPAREPEARPAREVVRDAREAAAASAPAPARLLRARALDAHGRPVAGLGLRCAGSDEVLATDADGLAALPCGAGRAQLELADERWTMVREPFAWSPDPGVLNEFVVAPRLDLAGRVVDGRGAPLEGAQVRVYLPLVPDDEVPEPAQASRTRTWTTQSDANGEFRLAAGLLPGGMLVARHPGHRTELRPQPTRSDPDLRIELAALEPGDDLLGGLVLDASGVPVDGARVALGYEHARTDARGRFLIHLPEHDPIGVLSALAPGSLPARLERATATDRDPGAWPDPLILRLGGAPLSISGRVLDAEGEPVSGVGVRVLDPTHFGAVEWGDVEGMTMQGFVEALLAGQPGQLQALTDERGAFVLEGLLPRAYALSAVHAPTLSQVESGAVEAGVSNLVLRLPARERRALVAGRVLGLDGQPIAGASVSQLARRPAVAPVGGTGPTYHEAIYGATTTTDGEGRFRFADVPGHVGELQVDGPGLDFGQAFAVPAGDGAESLELRVARSCRLEVDLTGTGLAADRVVLLDADGERLGVTVSMGELMFAGDDASLHGGRSGTLSVSERARTAVLYAGDEELLRLDLDLDPDERTVVRP